MIDLQDDLNYMLLTMGKDITQNDNTTIRAIIGYTDNKDYDEKKIITKAALKRGDVLTINAHKYLIENEVNDSKYDNYYKAYARSCSFNINFNFKGVVIKYPAIIDTKVFDLTQTQYFVLPNNKILVTLADTTEARKITENERFIFMRKAWKVTGIDETKKGLLILNCGFDAYNEFYDDMENEIPDRWRYEDKPVLHTYAISTSNSADNTIEISKTLQFVVSITDNGTAITNPKITYSSNNTNCTVSTSGLITASIEGSSTITASYTDPNGKVMTVFINVTVSKAVVADNYTIAIDGSESVQAGNTGSYTAVVKNNGIDVTDKAVTWTLLTDSGGAVSNTTAELVNITDKTVDINVKVEGEYVNLKATLVINPSISSSKSIYISSGW